MSSLRDAGGEENTEPPTRGDAGTTSSETNRDSNSDSNRTNTVHSGNASTNGGAEIDSDTTNNDGAIGNNSGGADDPSPRRSSDRLFALDLLRGLIVAIMAWDHCKDFFSNYIGKDGTTNPRDSGGDDDNSGGHAHTELFAGAPLEMYSGKIPYFLARFVSHLCAPGFSFLMGVGMVLLRQSRIRRAGWKPGRVCRFFVVRGLVLLLMGFVVRAAFLPLVLLGGFPIRSEANPFLLDLFGFFQVMTSLGLSMIAVAPFVAYAVDPIQPSHGQQQAAVAATIARTNHNNSSSATGNDPASSNSNDLEAATPEDVDATTPLLPSRDSDRTTSNAAAAAATNGPKNTNLLKIWMGCSLATCSMLGIEQYLVWRVQGPDPDTAQLSDPTSLLGILYRFTFIPGNFDTMPSQDYYPFVPWMAITVMGIAFGATLVVLRSNNNNNNHNHNIIRQCRCHWIGLLMLLVFVVVRLYGGRVFSYRGWPLHEGREISPVISFINVCKYPPSVCYILLTMGINLILLDGLSRIQKPDGFAVTRWLLCYGRVPLAFYIIHFYVINAVALTLSLVGGSVPLVPHTLFLWLGVLVIMKPICDRYASFKAGKPPDSIWRFF